MEGGRVELGSPCLVGEKEVSLCLRGSVGAVLAWGYEVLPWGGVRVGEVSGCICPAVRLVGLCLARAGLGVCLPHCWATIPAQAERLRDPRWRRCSGGGGWAWR